VASSPSGVLVLSFLSLALYPRWRGEWFVFLFFSVERVFCFLLVVERGVVYRLLLLFFFFCMCPFFFFFFLFFFGQCR